MEKKWFTRSIILMGLITASTGTLYAQANAGWTEPFPPFKIAGSLYYVGRKGLANYLITTS
jgi:metallo-beta-lactamase class B